MRRAATCVLLVGIAADSTNAQATFTRVGVPGTQANAMSADGSTVVGTASEGSGFWWHRTDKGFEILYIPRVKPGDPECDRNPRVCYLDPSSIVPFCVSADGSVIGGAYVGDTPEKGFCSQPFVWSRAWGRICVGDGRYGAVAALTPDGTIGFGSLDQYLHSWTREAGWERLKPEIEIHVWSGVPGSGFNPSLAVAAEAPHIVCGGIGPRGAFIADLQQGIVAYFGPPWEFLGSSVSADGRTAVGTNLVVGTAGAYRWTHTDGLIPLSQDRFSFAFAASRHGSTIVGGWSVATLWDESHGMRELQQVLETDFGLDLPGWILRRAISITPDGRTIAGTGRNPEGQTEAWIVNLGTPCNADWDADGAVTSADFFAFLQDFLCDAKQCPSADFNIDGAENSQDFFDFLTAFFEGCP